MTDTNELDRIVDKVTKLLAKAEDKGATDEEAQAFFAKAQQLMTEYAIEEERVRERGTTTEERAIGIEFVDIAERDEFRAEKVQLLGAIAKANNCRVSYIGTSRSLAKSNVMLAGHGPDRKFTLLLFASVWIQLTNEKRKSYTGYVASTPKGDRSSRFLYHRSFASAYATRIAWRLEEARKRASDDGAPGTALVLFNRGEAVDDWLNGTFGEASESRAVAERSEVGAALLAGDHAAMNADISGGRNAVEE